MSSELNMEWHSPQALADRADDGFRLVVRSAAMIVCNVPCGVGYGLSKLGRAVFCTKQKLSRRSTESVEATPAQPDATIGMRPREESCQCKFSSAPIVEEPAPVETELVETTVKRRTTLMRRARLMGRATENKPTIVKGPAPDQPTAVPCTPSAPLDMEALLREHSPKDKVKAIMLRKALDDLLHGSKGARNGALETLVELGPNSGPILVACSQEASPEVVEIALDGLRQLNWHCLVTSISAVLKSSDIELRIIALRAAGRLTDDRRRPLLEKGLRDPIARVRRRAISYVSWHDSAWAVSQLMRLCDDKEADVKWAAVEALMALRPAEACVHLKLMKPSLDPNYQRRATALLAQQEKPVNKPAAAKAPAARSPAAKAPKKPAEPKAADEPAKPMTPGEPAEPLAADEPVEPKVATPNVRKKAEHVAAKTDDTPERVDTQGTHGRKRKRKEPIKPSSEATAERKE